MKAQDIFNRLNEMNLTEQERDFIANCDQFAIVDLFGGIASEADVKEIIKEYAEEDE